MIISDFLFSCNFPTIKNTDNSLAHKGLFQVKNSFFII